MTDKRDCPDPWHRDPAAPHETYVINTGRVSSEGYRCLTCGMQTVTVEPYTPVSKQCPQCGATFEGMADVPSEICDTCFATNIEAYIQSQR